MKVFSELYPELIALWSDRNKCDVNKIIINDSEYWFKCHKCNHVYLASTKQITRGYRCQNCSDKRSAPEIRLSELLRIAFLGTSSASIRNGIEIHSQFKIGDYKVDFCIPEINLIIELYGDYYHCNPDKYGPEFMIHGIPAETIWLKNKLRIEELRDLGYSSLIIWESFLNQSSLARLAILKYINYQLTFLMFCNKELIITSSKKRYPVIEPQDSIKYFNLDHKKANMELIRSNINNIIPRPCYENINLY